MKEALRVISHETRDEFRHKTNLGKLGTFLACGTTLIRPVGPVPLFMKPLDEPWHLKDTAYVGFLAATDAIDGTLARATGGQTTAGAQGDPVSDKILMNTLELLLYLRGELSEEDFKDRLKRDTSVTGERIDTIEKTGTAKGLEANSGGKNTTKARMIDILLTMSPLSRIAPKHTQRRQAKVTRRLVESGERNKALFEAIRQDLPEGETSTTD